MPAKWLRSLYRQIDTLENLPERCAFAREREFLEGDLRQLIFKSHRIVFRIDKTKSLVSVVYFRHTRQLAIGESEE